MCDESTFDLTYNVNNNDWEGFTTVGGQFYSLGLTCAIADVCPNGNSCKSIEVVLGTDCPSPCDEQVVCGGGAGVTCTCDPFSFAFATLTACGCGHATCGSVAVEITIT